MNYNKLFFLFLFGISITACNPLVEEKSDIGLPPNPSFNIIAGDTPNDFILQNTTEGAFLTQWELEDNGRKEGEEVSVTYPFKGDYLVTMTTFSRGGSASTSKTLTVTQDNPSACFGNMELLTGCTEKTWILAPEANSLHVGPSLEETWWGNSVDLLSERFCHFDDRYIFRANGQYEYDNNGDFFADADDSGNVVPANLGLAVGCHDNEAWPEDFAAWGSGVHNFTVSQNSLTLIGEGAWIGLYKVGTTGEVEIPQSSVTLSILSLEEDRMVLFGDYGWGVWRMTFVPE